MITLLNSSKTLDMQQPVRVSKHSMPEFSVECAILVKALRKLSVSELATLMGMSEKLAVLNRVDTPFSICSGEEYSSGVWLIPL